MMGFFEFLNTQDTMDTTAWQEGFGEYRWNGFHGIESFWVGLKGDGINRRNLENTWVTHYENGKPVTDYEAPMPWEFFKE